MYIVSIDANSVDPYETAPAVAAIEVLSGSTLFDREAFKTSQQTPKQTTFVVIGALGVKSVIIVKSAMRSYCPVSHA